MIGFIRQLHNEINLFEETQDVMKNIVENAVESQYSQFEKGFNQAMELLADLDSDGRDKYKDIDPYTFIFQMYVKLKDADNGHIDTPYYEAMREIKSFLLFNKSGEKYRNKT